MVWRGTVVSHGALSSPANPQGLCWTAGERASGALFGLSARAVEIARALPGSQGKGGAYRYHSHDIYTWRAEGLAFVATLCPPVLWRSQRKAGEISFHEIMVHSCRMSR